MSNGDDIGEADHLVRRGLRLAAEQLGAEAITELEKAIEVFADHPTGRLHLASALCAEGRFGEAWPHLDRALELQAGNPAFHLFAGRMFFDAEAYGRARKALERAAELSPENDLVRGYLILTEWAAGSREATSKLEPDAVPDSTPFLARLLMLIESEMKGRELRYVAEQGSAAWIDRLRGAYLLWRAGSAFKRGRFTRAAADAEMLVEMQPGHPGAVALLHECRDAALQAARRRAEEDPKSAEARLELAVVLADEQHYEQADEAFQEAEQLLRDDEHEAAVARGAAAGDAARAGESDESAARDDVPDRAAEETAEDTAAKASADSDRGILGTPGMQRLRGRIHYGMGRVDEAVERLNAGAEPGFGMAETHYYLGLSYLAGGGRLRCLREFEPLAEKVCWAVQMRLREYLYWSRTSLQPAQGS